MTLKGTHGVNPNRRFSIRVISVWTALPPALPLLCLLLCLPKLSSPKLHVKSSNRAPQLPRNSHWELRKGLG